VRTVSSSSISFIQQGSCSSKASKRSVKQSAQAEKGFAGVSCGSNFPQPTNTFFWWFLLFLFLTRIYSRNASTRADLPVPEPHLNKYGCSSLTWSSYTAVWTLSLAVACAKACWSCANSAGRPPHSLAKSSSITVVVFARSTSDGVCVFVCCVSRGRTIE